MYSAHGRTLLLITRTHKCMSSGAPWTALERALDNTYVHNILHVPSSSLPPSCLATFHMPFHQMFLAPVDVVLLLAFRFPKVGRAWRC